MNRCNQGNFQRGEADAIYYDLLLSQHKLYQLLTWRLQQLFSLNSRWNLDSLHTVTLLIRPALSTPHTWTLRAIYIGRSHPLQQATAIVMALGASIGWGSE